MRAIDVQLLNQSAVLDNLLQEACQCLHCPVNIILVQVLGLKNLSALQNSEGSSILKYNFINSSSIGTVSSGHVRWPLMCPLREAPL